MKRGGAAEVASEALALAQVGRITGILNAVEVPAQTGWEAAQQVVFDTSKAPGSLLMSIHYILGGNAYVAVVDGTRAAFDRRMAQIAEILQTWKPSGRESETLVGRRAVWDEARGNALNAFIRSGMQQNEMPGASIALVLNGHVIHAAGFGVTQIGGSEAVTSETRFRIGSTTKALTTLMMARLIEQGLFAWETPVHELNPGFALADPALTRDMQMRHTVNASTGMPRKDIPILFRFGGISAEQRLAEMRTMAPTTDFGEVFQYSNHLVALGGYVAAQCAHPDLDLASAYDRVMQDVVFGPLGMSASSVAGGVEEMSPAAWPHGHTVDGEVSAIADWLEHSLDGFAPAGAAWSTASDLAKYIALELSGGTLPDGRQLVPTGALARRRSGGIKITNTEAYGLGLMCNTELGHPILHHGGNTFGFTSDLFFLPEDNFGAVMLTNCRAANAFLAAIRRRLLELAFGLEEKAEALMAGAARATAAHANGRRKRVVRGQTATDWLEQFTGKYENLELGRLAIGRKGPSVWAEFADFAVELGMDVREDRCFLALLTPPFSGDMSLRPSSDPAGLILASGQSEYLFHPA
jgi:CubicO group peptidase (beta-lactamase class C family)